MDNDIFKTPFDQGKRRRSFGSESPPTRHLKRSCCSALLRGGEDPTLTSYTLQPTAAAATTTTTTTTTTNILDHDRMGKDSIPVDIDSAAAFFGPSFGARPSLYNAAQYFHLVRPPPPAEDVGSHAEDEQGSWSSSTRIPASPDTAPVPVANTSVFQIQGTTITTTTTTARITTTHTSAWNDSFDMDSSSVSSAGLVNDPTGLSSEEANSDSECSSVSASSDTDRAPYAELTSVDLAGVADFIIKHKCTNVIVMTGAGVSVSAGIPDFRSPGTGLYDNLQKYNLPEPEAVFDLDYFRKNPHPFYHLAKELYPGSFSPTPAHHFIKLLNDRGILLRNYTQNIDGLERQAGIPGEKLVEAHGTFSSAACIDCKQKADPAVVESHIFSDQIPHCSLCGGYIKPDIVFFGEGLPKRFFALSRDDFEKCDLLIIMGTSLKVQPFAGLINEVSPDVPRLLINLEPAGEMRKKMTAYQFVRDYGHHFGVSVEDFMSVKARRNPSSVSPQSDTTPSSTTTTHEEPGAVENNDRHLTQEPEPVNDQTEDQKENEQAKDPEAHQESGPNDAEEPDISDPEQELDIDLPMDMVFHLWRINASRQEGLRFFFDDNTRDVFHQSTCDEGVTLLAKHLGWSDAFEEVLQQGDERASRNKAALHTRLEKALSLQSEADPEEKKDLHEKEEDSECAIQEPAFESVVEPMKE